jgi:peptidoglycan/LPS O-acetylase OafA/YrhL
VVLQAAAAGAAGIVLWTWANTGDDAKWLYQGWLAVITVLVAVVIAAVISEAPGPLGRVLSLRPVRWVGVISYGLYLWHWPVYVALTSRRTGLHGAALLALRLGCTLAVATASYYLVGAPIRRGALRGLRIRRDAPTCASTVPSVVGPGQALLSNSSRRRQRTADGRKPRCWIIAVDEGIDRPRTTGQKGACARRLGRR